MSHTKKHIKNKNRTIKRKLRKQKGGREKFRADSKEHIVKVFLEILNMVKLYHWKTRSYSQHKATDELYANLNENIDEFVEILLGKDQTRLEKIGNHIDLIDSSQLQDFKQRILEYRTFLSDFNMYFDAKKDSDLLSVRDQILGHINQFLYLLSFDKV
jgi:hypothetical protein